LPIQSFIFPTVPVIPGLLYPLSLPDIPNPSTANLSYVSVDSPNCELNLVFSFNKTCAASFKNSFFSGKIILGILIPLACSLNNFFGSLEIKDSPVPVILKLELVESSGSIYHFELFLTYFISSFAPSEVTLVHPLLKLLSPFLQTSPVCTELGIL